MFELRINVATFFPLYVGASMLSAPFGWGSRIDWFAQDLERDLQTTRVEVKPSIDN